MSFLGVPTPAFVLHWSHWEVFDAPQEDETERLRRPVPVEVGQIINMEHELVRLAQKIDWQWIDGELADRFSDKRRPITETRLMVGPLIFKHMFVSAKGTRPVWCGDDVNFAGQIEALRNGYRAVK